MLLCILSIINGLWNVKSAVQNLFFESEIDVEAAYDLNMETEGEMPSYVQETIDSLVDFWMVQQDHSVLIQSFTLLLSLLSILGVFMMYKLNKKGFIIYTIANLTLVIVPFIYYFNNTVGQLLIALQFFVSALFILLYASQLKHMRNKNEPIKI